jgi:BlaI family transcriptional regulator, penicillinase repressor
MARRPAPHPTALELEILQVLWRRGPSSVGEVRDAMAGTRDLAYTSIMTVMTIMTRKGYLVRRRAGRAFIYQTKVSEKGTIRGIVGDLVRRAFGGSRRAALLHLLETGDLDRQEIEEIRNLIDRKLKEGPR